MSCTVLIHLPDKIHDRSLWEASYKALLNFQGYEKVVFENSQIKGPVISITRSDFYVCNFKRLLTGSTSESKILVTTTKNSMGKNILQWSGEGHIQGQAQSTTDTDAYIDSGIHYYPDITKQYDVMQMQPIVGGGISLSGPPTSFKSPQFQPCLFLDRDGIVVENVHYMYKHEEVRVVQEVARLVKQANEKKWFVVVMSNQSGVGRGYFGHEQCQSINNFIGQEMLKLGARVDAWLYCPYHPRQAKGEYLRDSVYRKPHAGMVIEACEKFPIDLDRSLMLGDNWSDVLQVSGLKSYLVQGEYDLSEVKDVPIFKSHAEALSKMLALLT